VSGPLLNRGQLQEALEPLARRLHRRGVSAELYVFGGGAMVLAHNAREATMDLDAAIRRGHGAVTTEAQAVASELLGHARLETARGYTRPTAEDRTRALDLLLVDR